MAIAGGRNKIEAIRAVLQSRLLHGLITDEATARQLDRHDADIGADDKNRRTG